MSDETVVGLKVTGMTCLDCARTVERAISRAPGVKSARVHYLKRRASVTTEPGAAIEPILEAVREAGYDAEPEE